MNKFLITVAATASLLFIGPIAQAQTPTDQNAPTVTSRINLSLEQRHEIREIIRDLKIENSAGETHFAVGDTVPKSVLLRSMPPEVSAKVSSLKAHLFFVMVGKVVIVDPKDNKIVDIIE